MKTQNSTPRFIAGLLAMALVGAACGSGEGAGERVGSETRATTQTAAELQVSLEMDHTHYPVDATPRITFTVVNNTSDDRRLLKWATPLYGIEQDVFAVSSGSTRAEYIGRQYKRPAPRPEDYVTIRAGQTLTVQVDLAAAYDIYQKGEYHVVFVGEMDADFASQAKTTFGASAPVASTSFTLDAERVSRMLMRDTSVAKGSTGFSGCSASQQADLDRALSNAELMAGRAYAAVANTTPADRPTSGWYSTWFGAYDATRYSTVASHFQAISSTLSGRSFTFYCDCSSSAFAYVYATDPYKVHLCNAFWNAAQVGVDSKAGTLIHETSHFTIVAGTKDLAYGQPAARSLASSDPGRAIINADSHEYYAEGSLGRGFMITSDRSSGLAINAWGGALHGTVLRLHNGCTASHPDCTFSYRNGMIVSDRDPQLAINAWGGATDGGVLRLHSGCTPTNPDCTWTYRRGMFVSNRNPSLGINAWGGAVHGATLVLASACTASNPDCTWSQRGMMLTSDRNPQLGMNAYGGATHGAEVRLHIACTPANPDCTWVYTRGLLLSERSPSLAVNAAGGAALGTVMRLHNACTVSNPDCTWSYRSGMFVSDRDPTLVINAWGGAASQIPLKLHNGCSAANPDCTFAAEKL